jgi:hypothetical protein
MISFMAAGFVAFHSIEEEILGYLKREPISSFYS